MTSRRGAEPVRSSTSTRRPNGRRSAPGRSGPRISPGVIFLVIALVLSVVYAVYAVTVRDTSQIPLLASGAVVLGIAFGAFALYALSAVWRNGVEGRGGRAIVMGFVGGGAAMVAAGCLAGAIVLFMLSGSSGRSDGAEPEAEPTAGASVPATLGRSGPHRLEA